MSSLLPPLGTWRPPPPPTREHAAHDDPPSTMFKNAWPIGTRTPKLRQDFVDNILQCSGSWQIAAETKHPGSGVPELFLPPSLRGRVRELTLKVNIALQPRATQGALNYSYLKSVSDYAGAAVLQSDLYRTPGANKFQYGLNAFAWSDSYWDGNGREVAPLQRLAFDIAADTNRFAGSEGWSPLFSERTLYLLQLSTPPHADIYVCSFAPSLKKHSQGAYLLQRLLVAATGSAQNKSASLHQDRVEKLFAKKRNWSGTRCTMG